LEKILLNLIPKSTNHDGVAIIKVDAIGDFILWLDTANQYRKLYPFQHLVLITNKICYDLAIKLPYWDEVLPIDVSQLGWRHPINRWAILTKLAKRNFCIAIQPTYSRMILKGDSIVRATRAPTRIGSIGDLSNSTKYEKLIADQWYTKLLPASGNNLPELERNVEFFKNLTGQEFELGVHYLPPVMKLNENLVINRKYVVIFPGAGWAGRQWPVKKFIEVAKKIQEQFDCKIVLCGSCSDMKLCEEINEQLNEGAYNFSGKTTLPELVEVIRGSALLIANETSAIHISAIVRTPSICITGGGHFDRFVPYPSTMLDSTPCVVFHRMECYGCNWSCSIPHNKNEAVPCIEHIAMEEVMNHVVKTL
jgi:ADP-heptose:LPS heptosyltransferase